MKSMQPPARGRVVPRTTASLARGPAFVVAGLVLTQTLTLTGCAAIVGGQKQNVSVVTRSGDGEAAGAHCALRNDKGTWYATTPASVTVQRSHRPMTIDCRLAQHTVGTLSVASSTHGTAFASVRSTVRRADDGSAEAAYAYPEVITVNLGRRDGRL